MRRPRSLELQLVIAVGAIFLVATPLCAVLVTYEAFEAAKEFSDERLAHEFLEEFVTDLAWALPIFALVTLAVIVWTIRRGIEPVRAASQLAADISPAQPALRLPAGHVPTEIAPLVIAVNRALDRLEQGFAAQRQFTANAAHELRTPLAILTAGLENLQDGLELEKLLFDAKRMSRLVDQLLRVARLDSLPLDVSHNVDLRAVAAEVVEYLAPWAIAHGCTLGFDQPARQVWIQGNAAAISDAIRNLIENAVAYAPAESEVTIAVSEDGSVTVSDKGPGVPVENRKQIFERFWRGLDSQRETAGSGLGLAIVAEVARRSRREN